MVFHRATRLAFYAVVGAKVACTVGIVAASAMSGVLLMENM